MQEITAANAQLSDGPDLMTINELEHRLGQIDRNLCAVDPADLFPIAFRGWQESTSLLKGGGTDPDAVRRVALLAGQYAVNLAVLARYGERVLEDGDNDLIARQFAVVAETHARQLRDPLLAGRVAGLQSRIAMDARQPAIAQAHAANGRRVADPGQIARLAAYEAEAASAARRTDDAADAIDVMRDSMRTAIQGPADWNDAEEDLYIALTAANTPGSGQLAVMHGERAARTFVHDAQGVGLARVALARGHLDGDSPRPDEAAAAAVASLDAVAASPNAVVHQRVKAVATALTAWRDAEPQVRALERRLAQAS